MVVIELLLGFHEVGLDILALAPWQGQEPIEIIAHDGGFRRHRRHLAQFLDLGFGLGAGFLGERRVGDLLFQFGHFVAFAAVAALFAQLALDRLHLLVEVIFALGLLHLPLDAVFDLPLHLQHAHLAFHQGEHLLEAVLDVGEFEQFLLVGNLDRQLRGNGIGQFARLGQLADRGDRFRRDFAVQFHVILELLLNGAHQGLHVAAVGIRLGNGFDFRFEIVAAIVQFLQARTCLAFDENLYGAVGQFQKLENGGDRADFVHVIGAGIVDRSVALGHQHDFIVALVNHFERTHRLVAAHEERGDHVRKNNDVP